MDTKMSITLTRRQATSIVCGIYAVAHCVYFKEALANSTGVEYSDSLKSIIDSFSGSAELVAGNRMYSERTEFQSGKGLEGAPITAPPSKTKISDKSIELIIVAEISGPTVYQSRYQHPIVPGGDSGVTIGVVTMLGMHQRYCFVTIGIITWIRLIVTCCLMRAEL
jgi:hypothetical protein